MPSRTILYAEGDVVAIPLPGGGRSAPAVIVRRSKRSRARQRLVLLYAFKPPGSQPRAGLADIKPNQVVYGAITNDLMIQSGKWPVVGCIKPFNKSIWRFPRFAQYDDNLGRWVRVHYLEEDLIPDMRFEWSPISRFEVARCLSSVIDGEQLFPEKLQMAIDGGWKGRSPLEEEERL